jgi:REP-associated tyrosine transposase
VQRFPAHVTLKIRDGIPSLRSVRVVREVERSFRESCDRGDFRLVHYALQHNHAHLIVEAADASALARGMKAIGSRLARGVNRVLARRGPVLLERFHLRVLSHVHHRQDEIQKELGSRPRVRAELRLLDARQPVRTDTRLASQPAGDL